MSIDVKRQFEDQAREATKCRECFTVGRVPAVEAAYIDVAQPRWIGERYWKANFRVVILMCNPGEGLNYPESVQRARRRLHEFRDGTIALGTVVKGQRYAKWSRFYIEGLRLNVDDIAFANVAWCATRGNIYPRAVLDRCFERHTKPLLALLFPNVVLAAGSKAQAFLRPLSGLPSTPRVIPILHHAHRKGQGVEQSEFARVREELKVARTECRHAR